MGFIANWLARRRFKPILFHYFDGAKWRSADPTLIQQKLYSDRDCNLQDDLPAALGWGDEASKEGAFNQECCDRMLDLIRRVFGVKQLTDEQPGLTVEQQAALLLSFLKWSSGIKKKLNAGPT